MFHSMCLGPNTGSVLRKLADLAPTTLAIMHGSSFTCDGAAALAGRGAQYLPRRRRRLGVAARTAATGSDMPSAFWYM